MLNFLQICETLSLHAILPPAVSKVSFDADSSRHYSSRLDTPTNALSCNSFIVGLPSDFSQPFSSMNIFGCIYPDSFKVESKELRCNQYSIQI